MGRIGVNLPIFVSKRQGKGKLGHLVQTHVCRKREMINLSNVENWLWQQWNSCIYNIRIYPKALNLTDYKTVDGKSGFYYFSFIQYLNNFSTLLSFPSIFPEISKNSMLFFSADCYKSECIVRISRINVIKTLNVSRKEGGGRAINS